MSNATARPLCPVCKDCRFTARLTVDPGTPPSWNHPGDGPELVSVDEIFFEDCDCDLVYRDALGKPLAEGTPQPSDTFSILETKRFWSEVDAAIENEEWEFDEYEPPESDYDPFEGEEYWR